MAVRAARNSSESDHFGLFASEAPVERTPQLSKAASRHPAIGAYVDFLESYLTVGNVRALESSERSAAKGKLRGFR